MAEQNTRLKVAVIGAGISGLGGSWLLSRHHDVTVFEADTHFGGHANTVEVPLSDGRKLAVDTGFIVCNDRNYPNFLALLDMLNVDYVPTEMSFGISIGQGDFEYAGADSIGPLFAQKRNILRPRFWKMVKDLLRFYKQTNQISPETVDPITLRQYLDKEGYSAAFIRDHILPMAAAVWSTPSEKVGDFPLTSYLRFCQNHGLLQVNDRPQWYTLQGGSQNYVKALIEQTQAEFKANSPVNRIIREGEKVRVNLQNGATQLFDKVLIATHADTALNMIGDADRLEKDILGGFTYADNYAVLHSDPSFMPKHKAAWSSWNYLQEDAEDTSRLSVTYWMNKLQPLTTSEPMFVTLNPSRDPDPSLVHYSKCYQHPIFDMTTLKAQKRLLALMGHRNLYYAGAHFGYGFHEDGLQSGLFAAEALGGVRRPWSVPDMNGRILATKEAHVEDGSVWAEAAE